MGSGYICWHLNLYVDGKVWFSKQYFVNNSCFNRFCIFTDREVHDYIQGHRNWSAHASHFHKFLYKIPLLGYIFALFYL